MKVRFARRDDFDAVRKLESAMLAESRVHRHEDRDSVGALSAFEELIGNPALSCLLLACDVDGVLTGMLAGEAVESGFHEGLNVRDHWFYVAPAHRAGQAPARLLASLRRWAELRNAHQISIGAAIGFEEDFLERLMTQSGFRRRDSEYVLTLSSNPLIDFNESAFYPHTTL